MRGRRSNPGSVPGSVQGTAREYLSRMAEPVFPGEQALAARPVRTGWSREVPAPREEIVPWRETPSWQLRQESGMESRMATTPQGEDAEHESDRTDPRAETSAARLAASNMQNEAHVARTPLPSEYQTASMQTESRRQERTSSRGEMKSVEPTPREDHVDNADHASRRHAESELSPQIASAPRSESLVIRAEGSRAANLSGSEGKQPEIRANEAATALEAQRDHIQNRMQDRIQDRVSIQMPREERPTDASSSNRRDTPKDQNGRTNRSDREGGTRVRIGTVEVRTVLRQQAPAPAPAVAPQPLPAGRSSSSNAGPLARGLGWRFGLVQG